MTQSGEAAAKDLTTDYTDITDVLIWRPRSQEFFATTDVESGKEEPSLPET